jgi:acyl-coenzyme A thioesterase 13
MEVPREFRPLFRTSPVLDLIGPLYCRGEGTNLVIGLRVAAKHCNARETIHGGMLATLADVALGTRWRSPRRRRPASSRPT